MALCIEFKHQGVSRTATILKNRGITWFVRDTNGEEYQVQKKLVVRQWEESDKPTCAGCDATENLNAAGYCPACVAAAEAALNTAGGPAAELNQAAHNEPAPAKAKREKKAATAEPVARDPNLVTLKELCFELEIEPRIARRMLRKVKGNIGTGSRWEWQKGSDELNAVRKCLLKAE